MTRTSLSKRRLAAVLSVWLAASWGLSACGGAGGAASAGNEAAAAKCTAEAKRRLDAIKTVDPTELGDLPTDPVNGEAAAGKRVAILSGSQAVPVIKEKAEAVQSALALADVKADIFDTKINVSLQAQMFSQAVNSQYDAIYTIGVLASNVTAGLEEAAEAGIPAIMGGAYANDPGVVPEPPNIYAAVLTDDVNDGRLKANYALWDTECGGGAGSYAVMSVDYGLFNTISREELSEIEEVCPDCTAKKYQIDFIKDIVGSSRENALAAVNQDPNLTAILTADVWANAQVKPVRQSPNGKDVKFYSSLASSDVLPMVESGDVRMDLQTNGDGPRTAWYEADLIMRGITGMDASGGITRPPLAMVTPENVGQLPTFDELFEELEPKYLALWGLTP